MAIPINAASAILAGGQKPEDRGHEAATDHFERRVDKLAVRLWSEAGQVGSAADYRDKARAIANHEEIPSEASQPRRDQS